MNLEYSNSSLDLLENGLKVEDNNVMYNISTLGTMERSRGGVLGGGGNKIHLSVL